MAQYSGCMAAALIPVAFQGGLIAVSANQNGFRVAVALMATGFFAPLSAWADSDADALALAESTSDITSSRRNWRMAIEANVGNDSAVGPLTKLADNKRLSASFAYDGLIAPGLRTVFSNRLD